MQIHDLIAPLGVLTFTSLVLTVITGAFRRKIPHWLKWHKRFAYSTLILALGHVLVVSLS